MKKKLKKITKYYKPFALVLVLIFIVLAFYISMFKVASVKKVLIDTIKKTTTQTTIAVTKKFSDPFNQNYTLEEAGSLGEDPNPTWWVDSGAFMYVKNGVAETIQGPLASGSDWQVEYDQSDPGETDNGYYPQNIFRLVLRSKWKNFDQQAYYKINHYNLSSDEHRAASNGLLLFNRYQDGYNLYYAGLRVDGTVVIKKKYKSTYYTMAQKQFISGAYDQKKNPNLIPINTWIGVKTEVKDNANGTVDIKLYIDMNRTGNWTLALETTDDNSSYGGQGIHDAGYAGIRTDFMDVEFSDYQISGN